MRHASMLVWSALLLASAGASAAELTAAQVAERNVAARGGLEAWRAVNTIVLSGEMDAGGKQAVKLPFVLSMKRPHKSRVEIRFQDQTAVQTWDGSQGWKLRPFLNRNDPAAFTAAEAKAAVGADELDGPLVDYQRKGTKLELLGMEAVAGRNAYKLRLTAKSGAARNLWIDATTFLEAKIEGEPRKMDGKVKKVNIIYGDYQVVGKLTLPHVLETAVEGVKPSHKMYIKSVNVNRPIEDASFAKPSLVAKASPTR